MTLYNEVTSQVNLVKEEARILDFWRREAVFANTQALRADAPRFVFYEGPPTANGLPHIGHPLARAFKDLFPRYRTMKGHFVLRKGGWDTHGLPVELEVEKALGFRGKKDIEAYGVERFNEECKRSVFRYVREWERITERLGFWLDLENAYVTYRNEYIETCWWILRRFWDEGLIYLGYKVVPYCPRCGTALSSHELAQGYEEAEDPSIYVKFPVVDEPGTYFLVWTTTPWTLPGNVALAVRPEVEYVLVEQGEERYLLARDLLEEALQGEYQILKTLKASELLGKRYQPLYTFMPTDKKAHYVLAGEFVTTEEGTGIVHQAPAFGAEDMEMAVEHDLPVLVTVDEEGRFKEAITPWRGLFVKDADPYIIEDLDARGLMYRQGRYRHVYPFCWRCSTPLLYYARDAWYIATTERKEALLANNEKVNWVPDHIKHGRFGDWLANNVDWALSRERYWGTPLPIWSCEGCGQRHLVGSVAELSKMAGRDLSGLDLHRPHIDQVRLKCPECGGSMRRVPEVLDAWFDSGAMPYAQWHYPFENASTFEEQYPADFICEAIDQTRGWFYSLHAISTLLFNRPAYKACIVTGHVNDAQGHKMSKSLGNVIDPWQALNNHGADPLRWYFYTRTAVGNNYNFSPDDVGEIVRRFFNTLWNTYSFFVTYANIDGFTPQGQDGPLAERDELDRWILSELHGLVSSVDAGLANYDAVGTARAIETFVDDLSNWYVRRSRRRFWKSEADQDKRAAYLTLYECLTTLARLLAPYTPFLAENLYQNLVRSVDSEAPLSVHMASFPAADASVVDPALNEATRLAMRLASMGRAARSKSGLKVRQPLAEAVVVLRSPEEASSLARVEKQLTDELNVRSLRVLDDPSRVARYKLRPVPSVLGPKLGSLFPSLQKALAEGEVQELAASLLGGSPASLVVDDQTVRLEPGDVEVRLIDREGYASTQEAGYLVGVSTQLDPELVAEGQAREIVRRMQTMRKNASLRIEDRIRIHYLADEELARVLGNFADYVRRETLGVSLDRGEGRGYSEAFAVDGHELRIWIERV